jgi:hypothetical protein
MADELLRQLTEIEEARRKKEEEELKKIHDAKVAKVLSVLADTNDWIAESGQFIKHTDIEYEDYDSAIIEALAKFNSYSRSAHVEVSHNEPPTEWHMQHIKTCIFTLQHHTRSNYMRKPV